MGLGRDRIESSRTIAQCIAYGCLPALMIVASGIIELVGDRGRTLLRFDRSAIADGELWRLLSGHFVHLGPGHFALNAVGLILVWLLVGMHFTNWQWLLVIAVSTAGIDAGLWYLDAQLLWYVGMSGLLHGMLAAGIVQGFRSAPRDMLLVGLAVLAKILYEQVVGPLPGSENTAGGEVVVDAHLYGALAGVAAAAVFWNRESVKSPL